MEEACGRRHEADDQKGAGDRGQSGELRKLRYESGKVGRFPIVRRTKAERARRRACKAGGSAVLVKAGNSWIGL
jgi:hypothetical protein